MKIWLAKVSRDGKVGLIPTDDVARRAIGRLGDGECVECKIIRPRSLPWHKMYFGICRTIGENQDPQQDEDSIDHELRIHAGHFIKYYVGGVECRRPKRIAFDQLTADEWAELWPSLELAIRQEFGEEYLAESTRTGTW